MNHRQKIRITTTLPLFFLFLVSWASPALAPSSQLALARIYSYNKPLGWRGNLRAALDPTNANLYVLEQQSEQVYIRVIDWRNQKEINSVSLTPCGNPGAYEISFLTLEWVRSRLIHTRYCRADYLLDSATLAPIRKLADLREAPGTVLFSPKGRFALVYLEKEPFHLVGALYRTDPWEKVAEWNLEGAGLPWLHFTPDEQYVIAMIGEVQPGSHFISSCGLAFYEVPSGKEATRWQVSFEDHCPWPAAIIPLTSYWTVERSSIKDSKGADTPVLKIRNAWTSDILRTIPLNQKSAQFISTSLSISPDGRFAVAGSWDDPQDSRWSRDFIIWDLQAGEVAYQTDKYLSVWGQNTHGREVYPSFSYDGSYLIVVKERSVEIWQFTARTGSTATN